MSYTAWIERGQRLLGMSGEEFRVRLRQQIVARADLWRYRWGRSFSANGRTLGNVPEPHFFFSVESVPLLCSLLRDHLPGEVEELLTRAGRICEHRFDLLGYEGLDYGAEIDWHWDRVHARRAPRKPWFRIRYLDFNEVGDSKITWELNRHQHLVTLAKAHRLSGQAKFAIELFRQWEHWHQNNPYPIGINWASSLEVAFRSLSWIWVYFLLAGSEAMPAGFRSEWLKALGISAHHIDHHLSTYFSPNTHLLGEGVALFFIGTLCPELRLASRWRQRGWDIIQEEAKRQVRSDGLHFEQSAYYHVYALDFFLHAALLARANAIPVSTDFDKTLERMLGVICLLGSGGPVARFGDDDGGRVFDGARNRVEHMLDPLASGAVLFGRGDFKWVAGGLREETIWLLGKQGVVEFERIPAMKPAFESVVLEASGLYVIDRDEDNQQLVIDAGPQGVQTAGHGHADALSVVLNGNGRAILIDPGTFEYVGETSERNRFRGTPAHNTLTVDGLPQAEPKGPFGWERLPRVSPECWINGRRFDLFVGSHDGYARLAEPVIHRRWVFSLKSEFWLVRDVALGAGNHRVDLYWHLSPTLSLGRRLTNLFSDSENQIELFVMATGESDLEAEVLVEQWSSAYGRKAPCQVVRCGGRAELPVEFVTLFGKSRGAATDGGRLSKIQNLQDAQSVSGFCYETKEAEHSIFFGEGAAWTCAGWRSDAQLLYRRAHPNGSDQVLICSNFTFVEHQGAMVMYSRHPVLRSEIFRDNGHTEVICPDPDVTLDRDQVDVLFGAMRVDNNPQKKGTS